MQYSYLQISDQKVIDIVNNNRNMKEVPHPLQHMILTTPT